MALSRFSPKETAVSVPSAPLQDGRVVAVYNPVGWTASRAVNSTGRHELVREVSFKAPQILMTIPVSHQSPAMAPVAPAGTSSTPLNTQGRATTRSSTWEERRFVMLRLCFWQR